MEKPGAAFTGIIFLLKEGLNDGVGNKSLTPSSSSLTTHIFRGKIDVKFICFGGDDDGVIAYKSWYFTYWEYHSARKQSYSGCRWERIEVKRPLFLKSQNTIFPFHPVVVTFFFRLCHR
jgi:hypothetical protein